MRRLTSGHWQESPFPMRSDKQPPVGPKTVDDHSLPRRHQHSLDAWTPWDRCADSDRQGDDAAANVAPGDRSYASPRASIRPPGPGTEGSRIRGGHTRLVTDAMEKMVDIRGLPHRGRGAVAREESSRLRGENSGCLRLLRIHQLHRRHDDRDGRFRPRDSRVTNASCRGPHTPVDEKMWRALTTCPEYVHLVA